MAINKKASLRKSVKWNGGEVAQVRGLSSRDIEVILSREGESLRSVLDALDDQVDLHAVDVKNPDSIAAAIMKAGPGTVVQISRMLPHFLSTVVAVAADSEDLDGDVEHIAAEWPVALQFMALTDIAVLTFSGPEGFRAFVGNVLALVGLAKTLTGADKNTGTGAPTPSASGVTQSSS